ncbi:MAG: phosphate ABC transporter ATP-binding protein, partial [Thermofilaceae archaeon]
DEPTANLDPLNSAKIEELVRELSREVTVIIVTHDAEQARRLATRGAILFMGRVVAEGPLSRVLSMPYGKLLQALVAASTA